MPGASSGVSIVDRYSFKTKNKWGEDCDVVFWPLKVHGARLELFRQEEEIRTVLGLNITSLLFQFLKIPVFSFSCAICCIIFVLFAYTWHKNIVKEINQSGNTSVIKVHQKKQKQKRNELDVWLDPTNFYIGKKREEGSILTTQKGYVGFCM